MPSPQSGGPKPRRSLRWVSRGSDERSAMAKLLQLSRPNRRVSRIVRAWWAVHLQHRRRGRTSAPAPPAPVPVIVNGDHEWGATEPGWVDAWISWAIDYAGYPVASVEVWFRRLATAEALVATVPSQDNGYAHLRVINAEDELFYRVRYRNGEVVGAFSDVFQIHVLAQ